ncbi:spore coat protein [Clostridium sp. C2-6-12]|uniref:spore coat protein n=1 Tax=Clostridium sp. C2-6-12 TaxID=2698832 RepID=UPI001371853B|nr:spore coat protein [Clostridium sp. C2-6-12]
MSFLDALLGNDNKLNDKDIALDMIKDSKFGATSLSAAVAEAVNPELRTMLKQQLDKSITEHFDLSDIVIDRGWYPAQEQPMEQLQEEYENSQDLT